jgi:hypothetical protein
MSSILPQVSHFSSCKKSAVIALIVLSSVFNATSAAADKTKKRGEIFCFPAKSVPKIVDEIAQVKEKYRDVVDVTIDPKFLIKDGGVWPDRFYLAKGSEVVTELPFSKEDGRVPNFMSSVRAAPDSDICVEDPTRADRPFDDEGLYFEMGLSPFFHNTTGQHSMKELEKGTKDGKKFYKKMIPDVFAFLMPDTDYLAVKYDDPKTVLQAFAFVNGEEVALSSVRHKDFDVLSCEDLEDMNATALIIKGGPYQLQPVPSPKTMRRFGWGQKEDS